MEKVFQKPVLIVFIALLSCFFPFSSGASEPDPFRMEPHDGGSSIFYRPEGGTEICLTENIPGFNLGPQLIRAGQGTWVVWEINREGQAGVGVYDLARYQAREHMLEGIRDIGQLEARVRDEFLSDLFFIAKGNHVDVYHYRTDTLRLKNLTNDKAIEHRIALEGEGDLVDLQLERIDSYRRLRFDCRLQKVTEHGKIQWRKKDKKDQSARAKDAADSTLDDCYVAFGDSITAGKMYLPEEGDNDLTGGQYRPEYAYGEQLMELLTEEGYRIEYTNAGVGEDTTARGRDRIDMVLDSGTYTTLIVMLGTNDMIQHLTIPDQSIDNIRYIVDAASARQMRILLCTIPPRNDKELFVVAAFAKTLDYNERLRVLADAEGLTLIDVYPAFMNDPDGYIYLLEERNDAVSSGCHPNPEGHALIAGLMKAKYDLFLLKPPEAVASTPLTGFKGSKVTWQAPNSQNIDHYVFEFGTSAGSFPSRIELEGYEVQFILLQRYFSVNPVSGMFRIVQEAGEAPQVIFQRGATVYYRIKTVNRKGVESRYSETGSLVLN